MFNRTRKGVPCVLMFLLILIAFGCAEKNRQANLTDDLARTFDDYFQTLTRNGEFSGSVLVVKNGHIRLHRGYGFADRELKTLNDPRTKFRIGSITKCFTAVLAMKLVEEGRLSLEGKINGLPERHGKQDHRLSSSDPHQRAAARIFPAGARSPSCP
jgi:CubicO group peptidase (beta-lactamase class C family)